jgi:hypothetical protein
MRAGASGSPGTEKTFAFVADTMTILQLADIKSDLESAEDVAATARHTFV